MSRDTGLSAVHSSEEGFGRWMHLHASSALKLVM